MFVSSTRAAATLLVASLAVLAGCLGGADPGTDAPTAERSTTQSFTYLVDEESVIRRRPTDAEAARARASPTAGDS